MNINITHDPVSVELIDYMGTDDSVVNAARVSFSKTAVLYTQEQNHKLLRYLAKHNHWSPFSHTSITLRVKAPVFLARQLVKHHVGGAWNEVSRRYVDTGFEFYVPTLWRARAENKKQGSAGPIPVDALNFESAESAGAAAEYAVGVYESMVRNGIAPEQARMVLPQSLMTEWFWTGSVAFWNRVYRLRSGKDAQWEARQFAAAMSRIVGELFTYSWDALGERDE